MIKGNQKRVAVGDIVTVFPDDRKGSYKGVVAYIHPEYRFITVQIGKYKESFWPEEINVDMPTAEVFAMEVGASLIEEDYNFDDLEDF